MPGYKDIVRSFNTSAPFLNAVLSTTAVSSGSTSPLVSLPRRKVLRESDRTRNAVQNRRQTHIQQRFREVYRERRQLIERHRDAIESIDQQDLSSIVEAIEFSQSVDKNVLKNIVNLIKQDPEKLSKLNDRQFGGLISAGGRIADEIPIDIRCRYIESVWESLKENSIPLDVLSYNAWISANIDNGVEQDPIQILKELGTLEIQPDEQTFGLLSKIYALKGQTSGILKIIDLLKEQNIPATQFLFESLVYSLSFNGDDQQVKTIIQSLSANPAIDASGLYLSAALGTARSTKNVDKVVNVLTSIPHSVGFKKRENLHGMVELIIDLIQSNATGVVPKLRAFMFLDQKYNLPNTYPMSSIVRKIHQLCQQGNESGAVELFSLLSGDVKNNVRRYFEEELFKKKSEPEKIVELANLLKENNVLLNPLTKLVDKAYGEKLPIFPFYSIFVNSTEFKSFEDRKHLQIPKIVMLIKNLKKLDLNDSTRHRVFEDLFNTIEFNQLPGEIKKEISLLIVKEAENEEEFSKFLNIHKKFSKLISTILISEIMWTEKLEKLESLMNGPLTNEKVYLSRILPSIMRVLKQNNITETELRTISKVICAGFSQDGQTGSMNGSYGFRIIREIFVSNFINDQRLNSLVRLLSEDPNVSLSTEEIKKIESELRSGNKAFRADLIKQLQRKSKAVIRWLSSDIEKLEKEMEYLESTENVKPGVKARLYEILLKKYSDEKEGNNGKEMFKLIKKFDELDLNAENGYFHPHRFVNVALYRSLQNNDFETAEKLWLMKKDHSDELKLLYCLILVDRGENSKAMEILKDLKKTPEDHLLIRTLQNKVNDSKTLEKFIELIKKGFSISNLTRRRLTNVVKKMELRNAISEGNLDEAFKIATATTNLHGDAFGQNDLMAACVKYEKPEMLKKVFSMVVGKHDKVTAIVDMMIAFLECDKYSKAEQLYKRAVHANFYISSSKLEYLTSRELELKRPDVLHNLFLLVNDPDRISSADLMVMLEKTINMYKINDNLEDLKKLQADIVKVKFNLDRKLKAHLDNAIMKVTTEQKKQIRTDSISSSQTQQSLSSNVSSSDEKEGQFLEKNE